MRPLAQFAKSLNQANPTKRVLHAQRARLPFLLLCTTTVTALGCSGARAGGVVSPPPPPSPPPPSPPPASKRLRRLGLPRRLASVDRAGSHGRGMEHRARNKPVTTLTQNQAGSGRLNELEKVITQSLAVWTGVSGTSLVPATIALTRTTTQNACGSDGVNSICFDQADAAFTPGILAYARHHRRHHRLAGRNGRARHASRANSRCGYLLGHGQLRDYVCHARCIAGGSDRLRSRVVADAAVRPRSRIQPHGGLERDDVPLRTAARHLLRR
jgi:hypothetical protein